MSNRDIVITLTVLVVVLLGISVTLFIRYSAYQERCELQEQRIGNLQTEIAGQEQEIGSLQEENADQKEAVEALEEKLAGTLPYTKANGSVIALLNNYGNVHNPSWIELKAFLKTDNTEKNTYSITSFVCGDFAEMLHNNAERAGIRAGVAIIHFENDPIPHALNVFYNTDWNKLIYIDCTGGALTYSYNIYTGITTVENIGEDKVAYVVEGKEYGLVPLVSFLGSHYPTGYNFYELYAQDWESYNRRVEGYNAEVDAYTAALGGRYFLEEPEYSEFAHWYDRLEGERLMMMEVSEQLGDYWYESLGIVTSIEIYWNAMVWSEPQL